MTTSQPLKVFDIRFGMMPNYPSFKMNLDFGNIVILNLGCTKIKLEILELNSGFVPKLETYRLPIPGKKSFVVDFM